MNQSNEKDNEPIMSDAVTFTLDLAGNFRSANKAAERLVGYSASELKWLNVLDLLPGKRAAELIAMANRRIRQRFGRVYEIEITASHRRQIPIEVSVELARRADGELEFRGIAVAKNLIDA